jgi:uncharacterized protein
MARLRIVLDTNVLVSGIVYPASIPGRILAAWQQGGVDLVLSRYILDEMTRVLPRLKRCVLDEAEIRDMAENFMLQAEVIEPDAAVETKQF